MTVSAVRPWRKALQRERSLPSGVVGPVLFSALRRLASTCLSELIEDQLELALFVRPAKAGVFSRDQTCRGKSQKPRSLDGRVEGNQDSEAHRQGLLMGDHESPGRNESVNAKWPRNQMNPRAEPTNEGRRQHGAAGITTSFWTCAIIPAMSANKLGSGKND